jgi:hypothetical protein
VQLGVLLAWLAACIAYAMAWFGLRRGSNTDNHQPLAPVEKLKGYFDLAKVSQAAYLSHAALQQTMLSSSCAVSACVGCAVQLVAVSAACAAGQQLSACMHQQGHPALLQSHNA